MTVRTIRTKVHWRRGTGLRILEANRRAEPQAAAGERCAFTSQAVLPSEARNLHGDAGARWRAVARYLRSQADAVASVVFPACCALCQTPLAHFSRVPVCSSCWSDLPAQCGILCLHCGEALGPHLFATDDRAPGDWLCRPCRLAPPAFDRAVAWGLYQGTMRGLLHLLKYDGMQPVAVPLGRLMAAQIAAQPAIPQTMTVVPVPLFAGKRRQRGFNQAEALACAVARAGRVHGLTLRIDPGLLVRTRDTASQAGLTPAGRRRNVRAAFALHPRRGAQPLAGQDVLLIDDIYTTGATARAAAAVLRRAGAGQVWVATAARAQRQEKVEAQALVSMEEDVAFWN